MRPLPSRFLRNPVRGFQAFEGDQHHQAFGEDFRAQQLEANSYGLDAYFPHFWEKGWVTLLDPTSGGDTLSF